MYVIKGIVVVPRRKNKQPYRSGYCLYGNHQKPCKGEVLNGSLVKPRVTLCACECHGDYESRLVAAGQTLNTVEVEEDNQDDAEA